MATMPTTGWEIFPTRNRIGAASRSTSSKHHALNHVTIDQDKRISREDQWINEDIRTELGMAPYKDMEYRQE